MIFKHTLILFLIAISCNNKPTQVSVISTLHSAHKENPNYNYEDLYAYIDRFDPDIIGVELRPEDVDSSVTYLKQYYPFEMYEVAKMYSAKDIYGIDWLGSAIEGKAIYPEYFSKLEVMQLQNQLAGDTNFLSILADLDSLAEEKNRFVMSASIQELNDGRYDSLNTLYYCLLDSLYAPSNYAAIADFYRQRDKHITDNILRISDNNPGKKILFLVGADHRSRAVEALRNKSKTDHILLVDVN